MKTIWLEWVEPDGNSTNGALCYNGRPCTANSYKCPCHIGTRVITMRCQVQLEREARRMYFIFQVSRIMNRIIKRD